MSQGPREAELQQLTVAIVTVCLVLSITSFALRVYARCTSAAKCWWDDYWMIFVCVVCLGLGAGGYVGLAYGSGVHQSALDDKTVRIFRKNLFALMLLWATGAFGVKIGILLFYWRAFTTKHFRVVVSIVGMFSVCSFLANVFSFMFQCIPIESFWRDTHGTCFNQNAMYLASGIINVIGDVVVLVLPLPVVWSLHTSTNRKVSLSLLFLLGAFVCIASIFRLMALTQNVPDDITHSTVASGLWSAVEVQTGFICANLPFTRPLVARCLGRGERSLPSEDTRPHSSKANMTHAGPTPLESPGVGFSYGRPHSDDRELLKKYHYPGRHPVLLTASEKGIVLQGFSVMSSRANVGRSVSGITVSRVVALQVEALEPGHRARSFETHVTSQREK